MLCKSGKYLTDSIVKWTVIVMLLVDFKSVMSLHTEGPILLPCCDTSLYRPALVWATWDLIAMVEQGKHEGLPTHSVQFVWNHGCNPVSRIYLQSHEHSTVNHANDTTVPGHEMHFFL